MEGDSNRPDSPFKSSPSLIHTNLPPESLSPALVSPPRIPLHGRLPPPSPPKPALDLYGLYTETSRDFVHYDAPFPFSPGQPPDHSSLQLNDFEDANFVKYWFSEPPVASLDGLSDPQTRGLLSEEHVREIWSHFFKYHNYLFVLLDPVRATWQFSRCSLTRPKWPPDRYYTVLTGSSKHPRFSLHAFALQFSSLLAHQCAMYSGPNHSPESKSSKENTFAASFKRAASL
jgi:hypothetical protein